MNLNQVFYGIKPEISIGTRLVPTIFVPYLVIQLWATLTLFFEKSKTSFFS
jgi:hypothetical protein